MEADTVVALALQGIFACIIIFYGRKKWFTKHYILYTNSDPEEGERGLYTERSLRPDHYNCELSWKKLPLDNGTRRFEATITVADVGWLLMIIFISIFMPCLAIWNESISFLSKLDEVERSVLYLVLQTVIWVAVRTQFILNATRFAQTIQNKYALKQKKEDHS